MESTVELFCGCLLCIFDSIYTIMYMCAASIIFVPYIS